MATTLNWPSVLAEVLVSGAPIRENGLVGWWSMNRTALDGAVLRDDSGNGNHGTIVGATPVDGVSGKALSFDGVDDYVSIPASKMVNQSMVFASARIRKNSAGLAGLIVGKDNGALAGSWGFFVTADALVFRSERVTTSGRWAAPLPSDTNWHHVSVVYNSSSTANDPVFFVDGAVVATTETATPVGAVKDDSLIPTYIGALPDTQRWAGTVDELRIYNRALTAEEVAALYRRVTSYQALPEFPMPDGFSETVQDGALRSRSDSGLEKIRRRFTATPTLYSTRYQLTAEQKQLLDYFYRTTTRGGTLRFNWPHPHGYSVEARFRAPPVYTATDVEVIADVRLEVAA
ncbi:MAG TPA: LamG domain-containing protein [Planctomycetota bacterium]|nr:LamG domain-containing protein [Planctomycetota bacterium]